MIFSYSFSACLKFVEIFKLKDQDISNIKHYIYSDKRRRHSHMTLAAGRRVISNTSASTLDQVYGARKSIVFYVERELID